MKRLVWLLRLGIVAFGAALIFESVQTSKHQPKPRVYVVNQALERRDEQRDPVKKQLQIPQEVLRVPQVAPVSAEQSLTS
ncbi:hypothetical protein D1831_07625 [Lactiplantibacillus garii]|uniref:Uncharacterized protein n=1 Tax=Lactiplantibacillus garii TaxID=2306423 RepID=A0A3R8LJW8_9LACO|nr:hypothetical protein [Lactiplantibacillus garii]RRK10419.1 hypothetical protein D1831_07625 [Lactiplantibacillus garii]